MEVTHPEAETDSGSQTIVRPDIGRLYRSGLIVAARRVDESFVETLTIDGVDAESVRILASIPCDLRC